MMRRCVRHCVKPALLRAMRAKWSARRLADARRVAAPSSPNDNHESAFGLPAKRSIGFGGSSSGRTTVSDTVYLGSNPSPPAKQGPPLWALFFRVADEDVG